MPTERVLIRVDEKGTRTVQRNLRGVGAAGAGATSQVKGLQNALVALGGALVLRSSIALLASFSQEMSTVRAITGATSDEFVGLNAIARELGATTRFAATEAAQGLSFLARAGFNAAEAIETIDDVLNLAQAGALDLAAAADIASNILRGFRLGTDQAGRVVDVLALAANRSNTNVLQLGDALKFVAPIAAGVGVGIEETTAAVSALSNAGLQASLAGTGLRRILSELESPSAKSAKLLRGLGLAAEDVRVSQVGLTVALERLAKAGIDTGTALEIFGDRGGPAFEVLRQAASDGSITRLRTQLDGAGGTAKQVAEIMDANLNGALLALKSAAQEVILAFGDMGGSMNLLVKIVNALTTALRFLGERTEIVAGVLTVILIPALKTTFALIAAHPIGLLLIALGAVVGALVAFKDELFVTGDGITTLGDVIAVLGENLQETFRWIKDVGIKVLYALGIAGDDAARGLNLSFRDIVRYAGLAFDAIPAIALGAWTALVATFQQLPNVLGDIFYQGANKALSGIEYMINSAIQILNAFIGDAEYAYNFTVALAGKETTQFGRIGTVDLGQIKNPYVGAARELGGIVAESFKIGFNKYGTPLADVVDDVFDRAEARAKERKKQLGREAAFEVAPRAGGLIGTTAAGPLGGVLGAGAETAGRVLLKLAEGTEVAEFFDKAGTSVEKFAAGLKATNTEAEQLPTFLDGMKQGLKELDASAVALGKNVGERLVGAFDDATGALADFAATGFRNVEDLQSAFSDLFASLGRDILQLIIKTLILKAIGGALGGTGSDSGIAGAIGGLVGAGAGAGAAGKAAGGSVIADRPYITGERGIELFVPPSSGTIVPNHRLGGQEPVNLTVVNIDNEESIPRAMNGPEGDNVILNSIERNPEAVKGVLGL